MSNRIDAKQVIGKETTPEVAGERLGVHLVTHVDDLRSLELDVRELAPETLVSSFVNSMLLAFEGGDRADEVDDFTYVKWVTEFESESDYLQLATLSFLEVQEAHNAPATERRAIAT